MLADIGSSSESRSAQELRVEFKAHHVSFLSSLIVIFRLFLRSFLFPYAPGFFR